MGQYSIEYFLFFSSCLVVALYDPLHDFEFFHILIYIITYCLLDFLSCSRNEKKLKVPKHSFIYFNFRV